MISNVTPAVNPKSDDGPLAAFSLVAVGVSVT